MMNPQLSSIPSPSTSTPRLSSLARRAAHGFGAIALCEGYRLVKTGAIAIDERGPEAIDAVVGSDPPREVRVRAAGDRLGLACACLPSSLEEPAACKHAWAALLEADRRGVFARLRETTAPIALVRLPEEGREARKPTKPKREREQEPEPEPAKANARENAKAKTNAKAAKTAKTAKTAKPKEAPPPPPPPQPSAKAKAKAKRRARG